MKNLFFLSIAAFCLFACSKQSGTTDPVIVNPPPPIDTTVSTVKYTGSFVNGPYGNARGLAKIVATGTSLQLRLEGFSVNSGPDLKVYLSKELQPLNFLRLGSLKALSGDQLYDIPGNPDFMEYRYALIHCEKFNHLFGSATLMRN